MAGVSLRGVAKAYGDIRVVRKMDLDIVDGEFLVLVGPSGCGKSTTLRMIAGLEDINEGQILIDEKVVNATPAKDRDIAMVFQNYALYPHMNVFENMAFGLELRKFPRDEINKRVKEAADILALNDLLDRKPKQLSGGQRQRVALGRAIVRHPKVFLFDEPLSNLDAQLRVQMRAEISKLHTRLKTTMIYVTHDQVEAMTMGTRIVVMKGGDVMQVGAPIELYNRPANRFVAGFIGTPSMNFIEAVCREDGTGGLQLVTESAALNVVPGMVPVLHPLVGKPVVVGVRPCDLSDPAVEKEGNSEQISFEGDIDMLEVLGAMQIAHVRIGGQIVQAELSMRSHLTVGEKVRLAIVPEALHVFDAATGAAIR